ncbi:hypothetical protein [Deinococcus cellulosilyticus]|uniref:Uncharacterized protein n=1 Tax=Deinococcus cellulosilyticus (strain DSM 18568 / NBRC 106333 / KACC 11606 / 5516J-15) TaxID=1223518 RepID=A0A511N784_DEIC1|nr:hypothetical protein [Deinococcus cellulosilyticus]GEM48719.1 hypothetical protein DC3_43540 [Deinococcus cellulosilyticus NBRC 106333 = KACC 11606]
MTHITGTKKPPPVGKYLVICILAGLSIHLGYQGFIELCFFCATRDYHHYGTGASLIVLAMLAFGVALKLCEGKSTR